MDMRNMQRAAGALEDALAQLDLAIIATQAVGRGAPTPSLQSDIADLVQVHDRLSDRLRDVTRIK